jgi:hypothetical protein
MDRPTLDRRAAVSSTASTPTQRSLTRARPWRCHACRALLGVEHDGELHVKYKEVQHWIRGRCRHVCRRCGAMNTLLVAPPSATASPSAAPTPATAVTLGDPR